MKTGAAAEAPAPPVPVDVLGPLRLTVGDEVVDLDEAFALADRRATVATSPTIQGFAHYVAGEVDALAGYVDLIGYWERTGGWIQQWTTLRNLARLLRALGDAETALFLEAAAHSAPDAPAFRGVSDEPDAEAVPPERVPDIRAEAATASRARVLEVARRAIDRHRAVLEPA